MMISPTDELSRIITKEYILEKKFIILNDCASENNQRQTSEAFSEKWSRYDQCAEKEKETTWKFQRDWYLKLYGFETEDALRTYLMSCNVIFDAGCGLGYKAAWFAELAPHALVIGMDCSKAARQASINYSEIPNLFFIQGDITNTYFLDGSVDYVSCDQVIMHTENPELTFAELVRICRQPIGQVACYFYAKKALPRELVDDYFRVACGKMSSEDLWLMSEQLTELGRRLSNLNVSFDAPEIPALGIKAGTYDVQRFIYWNFLKCFWNEQLGRETSIATNFDWYSPSNAHRFSEEEVRDIVAANSMVEIFFHAEEACYSGRFSFELPMIVRHPPLAKLEKGG